MALKSNPVPMPTDKVSLKKVNRTEYVYYSVRSYRNDKGKPTSDEVSIGKKDQETGMLIPNRRYFELYQEDNVEGYEKKDSLVVTKVGSFGTVYTLMNIAEAIGLQKVLEKCFPMTWCNILYAAFYMICYGNVMMYIEDWFDETDQLLVDRIDDQQCSRMFASITFGERIDFFKTWVKFRTENEYIVYDVTSVSTYSSGIDIAEWGYNRDDENLMQVNLGMFYGTESRLPVYYEMYNGSITDKSHFSFMMNGAKKVGIENVKFVLDRGFVSEANLTSMNDEGHIFVTALAANLLETKRLIDDCAVTIRKTANRITEYDVYAVSVDTNLYGIQMKAHIYYDLEKHLLDEKEIYSRIERLQTDLSNLKRNGGITKKYTDYFIIDKKSKEGIEFTLDTDKIDILLNRSGFYILISNDLSLSNNEVLRIYKDKDTIEKSFNQLKNKLDFKRLRTHVNATTDGKVFVGFIALILRAHLLGKIKGAKSTKQLTLEKVILELKKIQVVTYEDSSRALMPLTKTHKIILEAIGLSVEDLIDSAKLG